MSLSLLYPGEKPAGVKSPTLGEHDLGIPAIAHALDFDGRHSRFAGTVLAELCHDAGTIRYRQDVLADFMTLPVLTARLAELLPGLGELVNINRNRRWTETIPLSQVAGRLAELEVYLNSVEGLHKAFEGISVASAGLKALVELVASTRNEQEYQKLATELPKLRAQLNQAGSVTLGINLDAQLRPESATLLSINPHRFNGKSSLVERIFGGDKAGGESIRGIASLYRAIETENRHMTQPEHELYRELNRLLERVAGPVAQALARYTRLNSANFATLEPEIAFYLGASKLFNELRQAGLQLCRPEIAPTEQRTCQMEGIFNLELALRLHNGRTNLKDVLVPNPVEFGPESTIFILTGPNSGGKTTYARAIGQAQVVAQAGLLVPGQKAKLSPVDGIFTHFAAAERASGEGKGGRLAEELERLAQVFRLASRFSLILLNEPLASTDHASARVLSRDILAGLRMLGARTIFVTHIHELVEDAESDTNAETGVISLVAGLSPEGDGVSPTYRIRPGRPYALGYAAELARQYGLSLSQITQALKDRGLG